MPRWNTVDNEEQLSDFRSGQDYQRWLMKHVGMFSHKQLFTILHNTEFTWTHPFDENRAEDGISLRYRWCTTSGDECDYAESMDDIGCSVLEMLVALAISLEDSIMYDPAEGDRTPVWFWMMLENLELARYSDKFISGLDRMGAIEVSASIKEAIRTFMDRTYTYEGKGGLFPLREPRSDQREEELWYQANVYAIDVLGV